LAAVHLVAILLLIVCKDDCTMDREFFPRAA